MRGRAFRVLLAAVALTLLARARAAVVPRGPNGDALGPTLSMRFGTPFAFDLRDYFSSDDPASAGRLLQFSLAPAASVAASSCRAVARAPAASARRTVTGRTTFTLANNQVMLDAIRDHYFETGVEISMKPAGGIRTAKQALTFLIAVKETLGDGWLHNSRYRFGASALLNDLLRQLEKERTGRYQAPYAFSEAAGSY